jgi:hypothetical protein
MRHGMAQPAQQAHVARAGSWSTMPTAMNSEALNTAWFIVWKMAATTDSGVPMLSST